MGRQKKPALKARMEEKSNSKNKILAAPFGCRPGCQGGAQQGTGARGEQYLDSSACNHTISARILFWPMIEDKLIATAETRNKNLF